MKTEFKIERKKDEIVLIVNGGTDTLISNEMVTEFCRSQGLEPCDITQIELNGGLYDVECFAGRFWSDKYQKRATVQDSYISQSLKDVNLRETEYTRAFSSLNKVTITNIEQLGLHCFAFVGSGKKPVTVVADDKLIRLDNETFAFSTLASFTAKNISNMSIEGALSPHGYIKDEIENEDE